MGVGGGWGWGGGVGGADVGGWGRAPEWGGRGRTPTSPTPPYRPPPPASTHPIQPTQPHRPLNQPTLPPTHPSTHPIADQDVHQIGEGRKLRQDLAEALHGCGIVSSTQRYTAQAAGGVDPDCPPAQTRLECARSKPTAARGVSRGHDCVQALEPREGRHHGVVDSPRMCFGGSETGPSTPSPRMRRRCQLLAVPWHVCPSVMAPT